MRIAIPAIIAAIGCCTVPDRAARDAWAAWLADLHQRCPSHHVEWVEDGGYDDLLSDFLRTLPKNTQRELKTSAHYGRRCTQDTMGFTCEISVYLDALRQHGLLEQFTIFGCENRRCSEPALCQ